MALIKCPERRDRRDKMLWYWVKKYSTSIFFKTCKWAATNLQWEDQGFLFYIVTYGGIFLNRPWIKMSLFSIGLEYRPWISTWPCFKIKYQNPQLHSRALKMHIAHLIISPKNLKMWMSNTHIYKTFKADIQDRYSRPIEK